MKRATRANRARHRYSVKVHVRPRTLVCTAALSAIAFAASPLAESWFAHVKFLAADELQGRASGSAGHRKAAEYVADQFQHAGLKPLFGNTYFQNVALRSRRVLREGTSVVLTSAKGDPQPLGLGSDYGLLANNDLAPSVEADLVFIGYGLYLPEAKLNDTAGVDLKGKIVVYIQGAPSGTKPPIRAHASAAINRRLALAQAGAIGYISIPDPANSDIPWERAVPSYFQPSMNLTEPGMDDSKLLRFGMVINPATAGLLFEGSQRKFSDLMRLVELGKPLPHFELPWKLRARMRIETRDLVSQNVGGYVAGLEPVFSDEYAVVTGHLDHIGVSEPQPGQSKSADVINNGALDNAGGIAAIIEAAKAIAAKPTRRNVAFVAVTGEEDGLLGSRYFASHNSFPRGGMIGDLNVDMFLPLHPFDTVIAYGLGESTLKDHLERVSKRLGVKLEDDPQPKRVSFVRSDQYSFIRAGVPSIALDIAPRNSADTKLEEQWVASRYHSPSDDANQPLDLEAAAKFVEFTTAVAREMGDSGLRPKWNSNSFFRRFEVK